MNSKMTPTQAENVSARCVELAKAIRANEKRHAENDRELLRCIQLDLRCVERQIEKLKSLYVDDNFRKIAAFALISQRDRLETRLMEFELAKLKNELRSGN